MHARTEDDGYIRVRLDGRLQYEHVIVAEKALGRPLPAGAIVHHVDCDGTNNAPTNLVICPDDAYHLLLHQRMRALDACGNANWLKCWICKKYDAPERIKINGTNKHHPSCIEEYQRKYNREYHAKARAS